jgi:hypothetical protein
MNWCGSHTTTGNNTWNDWCSRWTGNKATGGFIGKDNGRYDGTASKDEADKIARRPSTFASDFMTRLAARGVLCQNNLADPKCLGYDGHEKAVLDKLCSENIIDTKCLGYDGHEKAVLDKLCKIDVSDTKCKYYEGHKEAVKKKALDAFCSENLWNPDCGKYQGHQEAVDKKALDEFCKIDVSDTKCKYYEGHKEAVKKKALDAFCSENLWNPDCGKYQGHQEAVDKKALDEFCSENITWTKCSGYEGHEEALLEVSTQLATSNALRATCRNDPWGQTCIGMPSGDPNSWTFEEVGDWFTLIGYGEWKTGFIEALREQSQDISLSSITTVGPFEAPYTPMDFFWRNFENFTRDVVTLFPRQEFIDARDNLFAPYVRNIGDIPPGDPNSWTDEQFVEWLNIEGFKTDLTMSIRMVREFTTFETLDRSNLSAMGIGGLTNWGEYIYDPSDILAARDRLFASVESEVETPPVNDATNWTWEEIKEWLISEGFGNTYLLDQVRLSLEDPDVTFQNLNSETLLLYDSRKTEILNAHNRLFASGGVGVETPPVTDATATYVPDVSQPYWSITNSSGDQIDSVIFITNAAGTATMEATSFWRKYPGYNATFDVREVPDPNTDTIWQATCEVDRDVGFCVKSFREKVIDGQYPTFGECWYAGRQFNDGDGSDAQKYACCENIGTPYPESGHLPGSLGQEGWAYCQEHT